MTTHPRYPVYVPSKNRAHTAFTVDSFITDRVPFYLVVEPSQEPIYRERYPDADYLVLPQDEMRLLGTRLWIREHSIAAGFDRHWQVDDNIRCFRIVRHNRRIPVDGNIALRICEDFTDRYTNIGVSGLNYAMFVTPSNHPFPPYWLNCHVYSCSLINNRMPYKWRLIYNDDTDLCLQVLAGGMCTVALNVVLQDKVKTMLVNGGNTDDLYRDDGRLRMSRTLEQQWPGVVETHKKFGRPQHTIKRLWRQFDTPLQRRTDIDWDNLPTVDNYGLHPVQNAPEIKAPALREILESGR